MRSRCALHLVSPGAVGGSLAQCMRCLEDKALSGKASNAILKHLRCMLHHYARSFHRQVYFCEYGRGPPLSLRDQNACTK